MSPAPRRPRSSAPRGSPSRSGSAVAFSRSSGRAMSEAPPPPPSSSSNRPLPEAPRDTGSQTARTERATFTFLPRGRVPELHLRAGGLMVSAEGVRAATRASMGGDAFVCVSFAACGAATPPLVSRAIDTLVYTRLPPEPSAELVPNLQTDAPLLPLSAGYERLMQLLETGPADELSVAVTLCEAASGARLATGKLPIAILLATERRGADAEISETLPLTAPAGGPPLATLQLTVRSEWGCRRRVRPATCLPRRPPAAVSRSWHRPPKDYIVITAVSGSPETEDPHVLPVGVRPPPCVAGSWPREVRAVG
mmetsp:Transcript_26473/g.79283  ORF Transcript_26473/g.79283 Transcript_26473/m.79283 type:complete len:310 (+) Transcript_26473:547-1476(+)